MLAAPVTTVSFLPLSASQLASKQLTHVLLAGLENGSLMFVTRTTEGNWTQPQPAIAADLSHQADVKRASWRVVGESIDVVTCSADHSVRLWNVQWS